MNKSNGRSFKSFIFFISDVPLIRSRSVSALSIHRIYSYGIFSIGDTLTTSKEKFAYEGIPTFAPEHFARVRQVDTMKRKQFVKGINQIAQEGAIQIFQEYNTGMEEIIVGVVGVLQFDVLKYRLKNEYNVEILLENLPYEYNRWIESADTDLDRSEERRGALE